MKEIRRQKIRKETAQKKIRRESPQPNLGRARDPIQPSTETSPRPSSKPKRHLLLFPYLADMWALRVSTDTFFYLALTTPTTVSSPAVNPLPLLNPLHSLP
jgi:hypothetical protein